MAGPIRGIRFIHHALQQEARDIERLACALEPSDDTSELARRIGFLALVAQAHTQGEEVGVFGELAARAPDVDSAYVLDHRVEDALFEELKGLVGRLSEAAAEARTPLLERLRRQVALMAEQLALHARKEEELLVPLIERLFTPAEQGAQVGRMMSTMPPEQLPRIFPWLVGWLSPEDRITYATMARQAMPPERFRMVAGWLREGLPPEVFQPLAERVPELTR